MLDAPQIVTTTAQRVAVIRLTIPRDQIRQVTGPAVAEVMAAANLWERYLVGPESGPDPTTWQTELTRPLAR